MGSQKHRLRVATSRLLAWPFLMLMLGIAAAPLSAGQAVDGIVASVDGEPLTMHDLKVFSNAMGIKLPEDDSPESTQMKREALHGLIQSKLMDLEMQSFSEQIDDRAIDRYIEKIKQQNHVSDDQFRAEIQRNGMTWTEYRKQVKVQLEKMELLEHKVRQKINITPDQVNAYYAAHKQEFTVKDEQFQLAQIMIAVPADATPAQRAAARKKADDVHKRAVAGEDFAALARQFSDDDSAAKGGELGTFAPDEILDQVKVAVAKLNAGQITEVVETSHGFHVVKVEAHQRPGVKPLDEISEEIRARLEDDLTDDYLRRFMNEDLMKGHHVETFL
jgi:peptidyl-prolyl cis-trans isomerase SurA